MGKEEGGGVRMFADEDVGVRTKNMGRRPR